MDLSDEKINDLYQDITNLLHIKQAEYRTKNIHITEIKQGVRDIFSSNKQLALIGDEYQYSRYLDTIFPNRKIKEILWHGTDADLSDGFDASKKKEG